MAAKRTFARLLRLRELEEEQSRLELERAAGMRDRVARELQAAAGRAAESRKQFAAGLGDADSAARVGAAIEWERARRQQGAIRPRLEAAETEAGRLREAFLLRRTARRQVETLLERELRAAREREARGAQQRLDDWFSRQGRRASSATSGAAQGPEAEAEGDAEGPAAEPGSSSVALP